MADVKLKPVKLHELLGGRTLWTDELWEAAEAYVSQSVSTPQAQRMYECIYSDNAKAVDYLPKSSLLGEFHYWPPTLLLGAFDLMRTHKELDSRNERRLSQPPFSQSG
jgi:hypothetical protein